MNPKQIEPSASAYEYPLLIKHLLAPAVRFSPHQEIVYRDIFRYDYQALNRRVHQLANMLTALGVRAGDTVAVMDWDSHRYLECFFAVPMMGAVLHTINVRLSPEQLAYTIKQAEDDVILVNTDFLPLLEAVREDLGDVRKIVYLSDEKERPQTGLCMDGEYESLVSAATDSYDFPDFNENTMATTFFTTGTTGKPKGVFFSHRQLVLHTYGIMNGLCAYRTKLTIDAGDVYMPLTPMFHVHAWGMPYLMTLLGSKQVYPGRYEPETILQLIHGESVTFSHCVPTVLHMLLTHPLSNQIDLSNWKLINGGSSLPAGLCRKALALGVNIISGYGMSETCPVLSLTTLKPHMLDWNTEDQVPYLCRGGIPIPNVSMAIIDGKGNFLPHDGESTGEIVVRAPWLTQGYLKDPGASESLWRDGWLHTGDVGHMDSEGYLQITDRIKDVIKTGGEWVSSLALEDILSTHPAVSESAVIGVPDGKWGERPMALVVLDETHEAPVTEEGLKDFFASFVEDGTIPKYGIPNRIRIVKEIEKTSVGKIDKKELRGKYA